MTPMTVIRTVKFYRIFYCLNTMVTCYCICSDSSQLSTFRNLFVNHRLSFTEQNAKILLQWLHFSLSKPVQQKVQFDANLYCVISRIFVVTNRSFFQVSCIIFIFPKSCNYKRTKNYLQYRGANKNQAVIMPFVNGIYDFVRPIITSKRSG